MKTRHLLSSTVLLAFLTPSVALFAQAPAQNIDPHRHPHLAAAQASIAHAYQRIDTAQQDNREHLGDHAQKAKDLLARASEELKMAAEYANAHRQ